MRVQGICNRVTERSVGDSALYEIKVLDDEAGCFDVVTAWAEDFGKGSVPTPGESVHFAVEYRERAGKGGVVYKSFNLVSVLATADEDGGVTTIPAPRAVSKAAAGRKSA